MEIRLLDSGDEAVLASVAPDVFDSPLDRRATAEFLEDPCHHIVVAIDEGVIVGFASAVHYVHPDKPAPELWINEVGVASSHQRRGIARAILERLLAHARDLGCSEAWVLTNRANQPAMGLYQSAGGVASAAGEVMFTFPLDAGASGS